MERHFPRMPCQLLDVEQKAPKSVFWCCEVTSVEEGHDVECVTEMMQLFSAGQQRRVKPRVLHPHALAQGYKPRSVMNFHLCFMPSAIPHVFVILDCNSLLLTIQFSDTLTPEVQNTIQKLLFVIPQIRFPDRVVDVPVVIVMCCTRVLTEMCMSAIRAFQ